jgi:CheY-like chemotaxis protein
MKMHTKTILILEDEPLIAISMEDLVRELGHEPITAGDIDSALRLLDSGAIDLGILDFTIRDRDSGPVASALQQRRIPFIVCSGRELERLAGAFQSAPHLAKPFGDAAFKSAIISALSLS